MKATAPVKGAARKAVKEKAAKANAAAPVKGGAMKAAKARSAGPVQKKTAAPAKAAKKVAIKAAKANAAAPVEGVTMKATKAKSAAPDDEVAMRAQKAQQQGPQPEWGCSFCGWQGILNGINQEEMLCPACCSDEHIVANEKAAEAHAWQAKEEARIEARLQRQAKP